MILNKTTNKLINIKITYADNFYKRFKGLMLKKDFNGVMIFTNLNGSSIHTHFMKFDIDAYFLDENKVVFDKTTLTPWKFYKPSQKAKYVLEVKKGKLKIKIGDCLEFI